MLANFLVCHEDEGRAGMEAEPSCTLDLSIRYDLIQFFGLITVLYLSLRINIT